MAARRPVLGAALLASGAGALAALVVLIRHLPIALSPLTGEELAAWLRLVPARAAPALVLRRLEAILAGLGLAAAGAAAVLGLVIGLAVSVARRRRRIRARMHVFGRRVA